MTIVLYGLTDEANCGTDPSHSVCHSDPGEPQPILRLDYISLRSYGVPTVVVIWFHASGTRKIGRDLVVRLTMILISCDLLPSTIAIRLFQPLFVIVAAIMAKGCAGKVMLSTALPRPVLSVDVAEGDGCVRVSSQKPVICMAHMLRDDWKLQ